MPRGSSNSYSLSCSEVGREERDTPLRHCWLLERSLLVKASEGRRAGRSHHADNMAALHLEHSEFEPQSACVPSQLCLLHQVESNLTVASVKGFLRGLYSAQWFSKHHSLFLKLPEGLCCRCNIIFSWFGWLTPMHWNWREGDCIKRVRVSLRIGQSLKPFFHPSQGIFIRETW